MEFRKSGPLKGEITVPGDKSISHRAVMFGSLAKGTTEITGFLQGADCLSTISCFESMGIAIENKEDIVKLIKALQSEKVKQYILANYNGGVVATF